MVIDGSPVGSPILQGAPQIGKVMHIAANQSIILCHNVRYAR